MLVYLENGTQVRGDIIKSAVARSDMSPVPFTFEADIRADEEMRKHLAEGKTLTVGRDGDVVRIIKSQRIVGREAQGQHDTGAIRVTALLDACHQASFVRQRAIIKENCTLLEAYRAFGAVVKGIESDFQIPRFYCPVGQTPTFQVARALQEEGGALRWKSGRLKFFRLPDLLKQAPVTAIPDNAIENVESGFLERHIVPWFFSTNDAGGIVFGNRDKPRMAAYAPFKNALRLRNMTRCLVLKKTAKLGFSAQINAGDVVSVASEKPLVVITAAHVFENNVDGDGSNQYSRLWLGSVEE